MKIGVMILIGLASVIMETMDSGLGMGFGTVLSPLLIIFGFPPLLVIPSILFSQAVGGLTGTIFHQRHKNADFKPKTTDVSRIKESLKRLGYVASFKKGFTRDFKIFFVTMVFGIAATVFGAFMAIKIPKIYLKGYIAALVLVIGVLLLSKKRFKFSWKKIFGLGIVSAFNKGVSGGGFGPLMTGGQIVSGNKSKNSIGATTFAEVPICIAGFLVYFLTRGLVSYELLIVLTIGALIGGIIGPLVTKKLPGELLRKIVAFLIIGEGIWIIFQLLTGLSFSGGG